MWIVCFILFWFVLFADCLVCLLWVVDYFVLCADLFVFVGCGLCALVNFGFDVCIWLSVCWVCLFGFGLFGFVIWIMVYF